MQWNERRRSTGDSMSTVLLTCSALAVATVASLTAHGQERVPGLTGADHADDIVMARQLLMDGIEEEMMTIEAATGGKPVPLDDLKTSAYRISTYLAAFPHLFPPQTKPKPGTDGSPSPTAAATKIWENFDDFYAKTQAATAAAYDASQAGNVAQFGEHAKKLRGACDGCHAQYMHVGEPSKP
jgi:cytochrome c556